MSDSPGKRLASFRDTLGLSQRALAEALDISHGSVAFIESDERTPSKGFLLKISDRYRVSADWLLHGTGEMFQAQLPGFRGRHGQIEPPDWDRPDTADFRFGGQAFTMIRRLDLSVSAGNGLIEVDGGEAEALAFSNAWLSAQRINTDLAVLVRVRGDSMAPGIPDGALVMVHLPEMLVQAAGIYAFNRGEASYVKRIAPVSRNPVAWVISSDNPAYPPETVVGPALNDIRIVGRVRCVVTTLV